MHSLLILGLISFSLSLATTPLCRRLFQRLEWFDRPDGKRKLHSRPIPKAGGVPIMAAYLGAFAVLLCIPSSAGTIVKAGLPLAWKILAAAALVFATGFCDDVRGLKPWQKMAGQVVAASVVFWAGVGIFNFGGFAIPQWIGGVLTVVWLVGCSNAFNLIDGVDGLSAGIALLASIAMLSAALMQGNIALAIATAPLAGSILAFLRYNFNPASIFLGDSGSLTIGFLLGCFGAIWSQKSATALGMTAPLIALAIPLLDVGLSILRRLLRGRPILGADRGHIHHMLLNRGLTPRRAVLMLYGVAGLFAALSLLQSAFHNRSAGVILVLFFATAWIGVHHLRYVEFRLARRMVFGNTFHNILKGQLALRDFEAALESSKSMEECWHAIRGGSSDFGLQAMEMRARGQQYLIHRDMVRSDGCWQARIVLSECEWVNFSNTTGSAAFVAMVSQFLDSARKGMQTKLAGLRGLEKMGPARVESRLPRAVPAGD